MMSKFSENDFKEKLEGTHKFPTLYMFKFIVPESKTAEVKALFPGNEIALKPSSKGTYVSVTARAMMPSSDSVIAVYTKAKKIEGIIAL